MGSTVPVSTLYWIKDDHMCRLMTSGGTAAKWQLCVRFRGVGWKWTVLLRRQVTQLANTIISGLDYCECLRVNNGRRTTRYTSSCKLPQYKSNICKIFENRLLQKSTARGYTRVRAEVTKHWTVSYNNVKFNVICIFCFSVQFIETNRLTVSVAMKIQQKLTRFILFKQTINDVFCIHSYIVQGPGKIARWEFKGIIYDSTRIFRNYLIAQEFLRII